jgi:hypothetical protein
MTLPVSLTQGPSNKSDLDLITTQKLKVYLTGKVTYDDVFREHHWVTFCAFLTPDLLIFMNCPEGNETDD